jgi:DNA-binding transcriptional LysR family regulator
MAIREGVTCASKRKKVVVLYGYCDEYVLKTRWSKGVSTRRLLYLATLAEEKHFGRAAEKCNISQPTLSSSIRQFEEDLGIQITKRGHRFSGFTQEGLRVLDYAKRVLAEDEKLAEDIDFMRSGLTGKLRIGVIPTALPIAALVTSTFGREHPGVTIEIVSRGMREILQELEDFSIDLGISYLDETRSANIQELPLYTENLALLTPDPGPFAERNALTWEDVVDTPLVLQAQDTKNRRIIDKVFKDMGHNIKPQIESNSLINLAAHVRAGAWSAVVPGECFAFCSTPPGTKLIQLSDPQVSHVIGLQMADMAYPSVVSKNFFDSADQLDIDSLFY